MFGCAAVVFCFFSEVNFQEKDLQKFHVFYQKNVGFQDDTNITPPPKNSNFLESPVGFDGRSCRHFQPKVEWKHPSRGFGPVLVVADLLRIFYVCLMLKRSRKLGGDVSFLS